MDRHCTDISLSRDCGFVMRGLAIAAIVLHNFCHIIPGVAKENEFQFLQSNVDIILSPRPEGAMYSAFDALSFFGWYGVVVFMFLTGYGLVMKYERGAAPLAIRPFLAANFRKLLLLMLPGVAALILFTLAVSLPKGHPGASWIAGYIFQLTMLPDLLYPWLPPEPGVFWYFGLTMQFYVIYAVAVYRRPGWWLWALVAATIAWQLMIDPASEEMEWLRHNATGWLSVMAFGVAYGRLGRVDRRPAAAIVIAALFIMFPSMLDPAAWQFSILAAVVIAIVAGRLSMAIPLWRELWIWVGRLSPMIFVAHPVARTIISRTCDTSTPSIAVLSLYLALTMLLALLFRYATVLTEKGIARKGKGK